jgi:hypothetical protein
MKSIIITLLALGAFSSGAFAQRSCGTMEYYQHRLHQDPSLAQRMSDEEQHIQRWTEENPVESSLVDIEPKFPSLEGFEPTGNAATDRTLYKAAKEEYVKTHPTQKEEPLTAEAMEKARAERRNNQLKSVNQ